MFRLNSNDILFIEFIFREEYMQKGSPEQTEMIEKAKKKVKNHDFL